MSIVGLVLATLIAIDADAQELYAGFGRQAVLVDAEIARHWGVGSRHGHDLVDAHERYLESENFHDLIAELELALASPTFDSGVLNDRGRSVLLSWLAGAYAQVGEFQQAARITERSIGTGMLLPGEAVTAYFNLAELHVADGNTRDAILALRATVCVRSVGGELPERFSLVVETVSSSDVTHPVIGSWLQDLQRLSVSRDPNFPPNHHN